MVRRLRDLLVEGEHGTSPLPSWLRFFLELGVVLGTSEVRLAGAVLVPVGRFAVAAICAGVVVARAAREFAMSPDLEAHVALLSELPLGAPMTYVRGGRLLRGLFRGLRHGPDGRLLVGIRLEAERAGGLVRWIDAQYSLALSPTRDEISRLPDVQRGERLNTVSPLIDHLFGPAGEVFARSTAFDAACIGNRRELAEDLTAVSFRWRGGGKLTGHLADIARVAELGTNPASSRARWQAARASGVPRGPVAIFSGAESFLRARDAWENAPWIAVLDRVDSLSVSGVETTRQIYLEGGHQPAHLSVDVPRGVELLLWTDS